MPIWATAAVYNGKLAPITATISMPMMMVSSDCQRAASRNSASLSVQPAPERSIQFNR
jgi:hypothetical protein